MPSWFQSGTSDGDGWRLDIVSLLAVIGESSMEAHSQALTASWTCCLPRIVPAPQALLKPSRPSRMPKFDASVYGVHNGTSVAALNYFANIIHPIDELPRFGFKVLRIVHREEKREEKKYEGAPTGISQSGSTNDPKSKQSASTSIELSKMEGGGVPQQPIRRHTALRALAHKIEILQDKDKPRIPPHTFSPLNVLSVGSCAVTIGLFIAAAFLKDGTAMIALATISANSSIVGYASSWQPTLTKRTFKSKVPDGDVMVLKREGAFLLVRCNEEVARELYTGPDTCDYHVRTQHYRILVGLGTVLLMVSVVFLGNCNFAMQAAIGLSYIVLNGLFWAVSLIKKKHFWNLDRYECTEETPDDAKEAEHSQGETTATHASYTRTLWYAIRETKSARWVRISGAAPNTPEWDLWLQAAEINATKNRKWDAALAYKEILAGQVSSTADRKDIIDPPLTDPAEQQVSAVDFNAVASPASGNA